MKFKDSRRMKFKVVYYDMNTDVIDNVKYKRILTKKAKEKKKTEHKQYYLIKSLILLYPHL